MALLTSYYVNRFKTAASLGPTRPSRVNPIPDLISDPVQSESLRSEKETRVVERQKPLES